ncbi:efflux RND transporter periplasmic adaptor subunit [Phormidium sp. LEGE 05292]|uniref:efflux RND transporter periplasmic adaptor subunit n=1 Tax=[Phormidium] sp. LEGE 05292 TaxID=767427 RepID=UPI00187EA657|nr:efflux RND transporter periplasmic adaptor subunit [Phormidium sp. LEGE 05292]MBE9224950.1 efflux RND transporter periplasmic adaptor subunit [Phormidium sp. LEGE 05292]
MTKLHIATTTTKKANVSFPIQLISAVLLVSLTSTACSEKKQPAATAGAPPAAVPVKLLKIEPTKIEETTQYQGQLQAVKRVSLAPQTSGRIQQINVTQGQSVKTGEQIMLLSPEKSQADVQGAQAQVQAQKSNLANAQAQVTGQQSSLANAQAQVKAQQSNLANAQARVTAAQADVARQQAQVEAARAEIQAREGELRLAQVNYDRAKSLVNQGALPRQELDQRTAQLNNARAAVNVARQQLVAAQKSLSSAQANVTAAQSTVTQAQANIRSAQATVTQAEANIKAAQATVAQAQAGVSQAEANVKAANTALGYNKVVAPINGVVGTIPVRVGDFVNTGQQVTSIIQNDAFELQIPVSVQRTPQLKLGLPVQIINPQNNKPAVIGSISFISPQIDRASQTILTKAVFPNVKDYLRDQLTVTAKIVWNEGTGILIPTESVTRIGNQPFVFVAQESKDKDGKSQMTVNQTTVQLGPVQGNNFQVKEGLQTGQSIAVSNILRLRNGVPITPEP